MITGCAKEIRDRSISKLKGFAKFLLARGEQNLSELDFVVINISDTFPLEELERNEQEPRGVGID